MPHRAPPRQRRSDGHDHDHSAAAAVRSRNLHGELASQLLAASTALQREIHFWDTRLASDAATTIHAAKVLPLAVWRAAVRASSAVVTAPFYSFTTLRDRVNSTVILLLPSLSLSNCRESIRQRRHRLLHARRCVAASLGLLHIHGNTEIEPIVIDKILSLLESTARLLSSADLDDDRDADSKIPPVPSSLTDIGIDAMTTPAAAAEKSVSLELLKNRIRAVPMEIRSVIRRQGRPSIYIEYWPQAILMLGGLYAFSPYLTLDFITHAYREIVTTVSTFCENWIVKPVIDILQTVRHKENRLAVMSASLESEFASLERMVAEFAKDHGTVPQRAVELVQNGDLTPVLQSYEREIKTPFVSAARGDLIRSLLIQIQKAKLDVTLSLAALDKLLKGNELNFAVLTFLPSFLFLLFLVGKIKGALSGRSSSVTRRARVGVIGQMLASLRTIDRILLSSTHNQNHGRAGQSDDAIAEEDPLSVGLVLCEVEFLRESRTATLPRSSWDEFETDLEALLDVRRSHSLTQRLHCLERLRGSVLFALN